MLRALDENDEAILYEMLYQSIFVPKGSEPPARDVVYLPELSKYVAGFGTPNDIGYVALYQANPIGAAWLRRLDFPSKGYGYVNDETPELSIALLPDHRGKGIGTALLEHLLETAKTRYHHISLSIWKENPAFRLYLRFGFEVVKENDQDVVMLKKLSG